jgi:hypothetical protein
MKLSEIRKLLDAKVLAGKEELDHDVNLACGCDLMSDVLRFTKEEAVLLTGLTNQHVLKTAEIACIDCIIFVRDKIPEQELIDDAEEVGIIIMATYLPLYEACGKLYASGLGRTGK